MNISTKSWHYRFLNTFYSSPMPRSLCPYFWKLVWASIVVAVPTVMLVMCFTLVGHKTMEYSVWTTLNTVISFAVGTVIAACATAVSGSLVFGVAWLFGKAKEGVSKGVDKAKGTKANIAVEFVKAKKEKVCPHIDYV